MYCYDTEWAALLGINIKTAIHNGTNVSSGLEDIISELKEIRSSIEKSKRYNREAFTMIRFLLVPLYLGTIYLAVNGFGFTIKKFIKFLSSILVIGYMQGALVTSSFLQKKGGDGNEYI